MGGKEDGIELYEPGSVGFMRQRKDSQRRKHGPSRCKMFIPSVGLDLALFADLFLAFVFHENMVVSLCNVTGMR